MKSLVLVLEGERPVSWNTFYAGRHWSWRKREAERVHMLVRCACTRWQALMRRKLPKFSRAKLTMIVYFKDHPLDASNICVKLYEDGLVRTGVLPSDKWDVVTSVTTMSKKDAQHPRVELHITEDT